MRTGTLSLWLCSAVCLSFCAPTRATASDARSTPQVRAVERARTAVVNIHSERTSRERETFDPGSPRKINGMGTGIIIDERGFIVTNQHVVAGVDSLRVTLYDGSTYAARPTISENRVHDLAIIKIDPSRPLPVMPLGTSSDLKLGETVLAVGNPFGYEHSVSMGIISSLSRDVEVNETQAYRNLLQTDASINPGNSGGPLLNLDGEVIGINVAIRANAQRIGFAIPIDDARRYIARLLDIRKLYGTYHGLVTHDVKTAEQRKLVVDAFEPNSPAAVAGLVAGDVITQVGAIQVCDQVDLERAFLGHGAGTPIDVTVQRRHETVKLNLQLASVGGAQPASAEQGGPTIRPKLTKLDESVNNRSWAALGMKFEPANPSLLQPVKNKYRGGMRVVDVQAGSRAAKHGIQKGDVLVGLHGYETTRFEDIQWLLNQKSTVDTQKPLVEVEPLRFYILRGQEVLYGNLRISQASK